MKTVTLNSTTRIFTSRLAAVWEAVTGIMGLPISTHMRDERMKVIVNHLKRDAAVTGNIHLFDIAEQLEKMRRNGGIK
ncbi:hypothetical protein KS527_004652 [Salmonella enterica]|nr:hypothetical protein [Salmonella enterica]EJF7575750.1 hypothetical protein [Salmonella enterica subsp. enterica]